MATTPKDVAKQYQGPGKLRSAWLVLMGQRIVPQQMTAEWALIQTQAADMFNKFSSLAARLVKAQRTAMNNAMEEIDEVGEEAHIGRNPMALPGGDRKAALRRLAYERRHGGSRMRRRKNVDVDSGGEE